MQPASQLTWKVLPQAFRDSPHLFGQTLSRDLQNFNSPEAVVLQYVNDILLYDETEEACSRALEDKLSDRLQLHQEKRLNFVNNQLDIWA